MAAAQNDAEGAEQEWMRAHDLAVEGLADVADLPRDDDTSVRSTVANELINLLLDRLKTEGGLDDARKERLKMLLEYHRPTPANDRIVGT